MEFADDTVLIARTLENIQFLLILLQTETAKHNLHLNLDKAKFILYNSVASIYCQDGSQVQQVSLLVYLGGLIENTRTPGPEVRRRPGGARIVFQNLKQIWRLRYSSEDL